MDAKLQRRVQRYGWDKAATHYEQTWRAQLKPAQDAVVDAAGLGPGATVLDVACGTGLVTFPIATIVGLAGRVVGIDISEQMVAAARSSAIALGISNVEFERMDGESLAFDDGSFDVVTCALGLMYVPDPEKAITEFHRVLKRGSRAAVAVWGQRSKCGWAQLFPIIDARVRSEVCPMFFRLGTGGVLKSAFASAGFRDVTAKRLETRLHYMNGDEAWQAASLGGPVALAYSRFSESDKAEARTEYLASIEPFRSNRGYSVPGEFVVVAGVR
jgi:ubiquinone/menaquinone biosynthesis C-methylase UbiE